MIAAPEIKSRRPVPIHRDVAPVPGHERRRASGTAWALSFLSTLASVVFAMAAIAGWVLNLWPASPLTLLIAALVVLGGPLAAVTLRGGSRQTTPVPRPVAPAPAPATRPVSRPVAVALPPLTPEQAYGRALLDWRDRPWR